MGVRASKCRDKKLVNNNHYERYMMMRALYTLQITQIKATVKKIHKIGHHQEYTIFSIVVDGLHYPFIWVTQSYPNIKVNYTKKFNVIIDYDESINWVVDTL
jgi:hypothetical protein